MFSSLTKPILTKIQNKFKEKKYHIITYGCQMNKADSERIASVLEKNGFKKSGLNQADLVILNLCSVRQTAIDKAWGKLREIRKTSKTQKTQIILTGCILNEDKKKFKDKADWILDINELADWLKIIKAVKYKNAKTQNNNNGKDYLCIQPSYASKISAYVPIMTGCNNFCTYCAVPYTRGRERYRPLGEILKEIKRLIRKKYKFITLLGQNVNSYKAADPRQKNGAVDFAGLLKMIDKIPGNYWLSFITSHPKDLSDELIRCFKECKHLIPYLHLPVQSGSNQILNAMNRGYSIQKYLKLVKKIRKINPAINLSTDIIVGFPNETEADFQKTAELMKEIKFDMAYIARYSPRPGTAAFKLKNNISESEKKRREKILTEILEKTALENNQKMIGKEIEMLVEDKKNKNYFGRTKNFKNIKISAPENGSPKNNLIGKFIKVKIIKANIWNLEGKFCKELPESK